MSEFQTVFGSLNDYTKGELKIINDDPKHYVFSNIFDVATKSKPYEKVVGGRSTSSTSSKPSAPKACPTGLQRRTTKFAIIMDGEVRIDLVKLDNAEQPWSPPTSRAPSRSRANPSARRWVISSASAATRPCCRRLGLSLHRAQDRRHDDADGHRRSLRAKVGAISATSNRIIGRPDIPYVVA